MKYTKEQVARMNRAFEALGCALSCVNRAVMDIGRMPSKPGFPEEGSIDQVRAFVAEGQRNLSIAQSKLRSKIP